MLEELLLTEEVHSIKVDLLKMLEDARAEAFTDMQVTEIGGDGVTLLSSDGSERFLEANLVVVAVGMRSLNQMAHQLAGECADVRLVGDCDEPRTD